MNDGEECWVGIDVSKASSMLPCWSHAASSRTMSSRTTPRGMQPSLHGWSIDWECLGAVLMHGGDGPL